MPLSIGIVGLPNVGKSTLFQALTKKQVPAENYPFCTIDPNVGVVEVPDKRLIQLATVSKSQKIVPTFITFIDIAGLVKNAHKGEGLGNQFLSHIREADAICEVVRAFSDKNVIHVEGKIAPKDDVETIDLELAMADFSTVENRIGNIEGKVRTGNKEYQKELELLLRAKNSLNQNIPLRKLSLDEEEYKILKQLNLLSLKPILYVVNVDENGASVETEKIKSQLQFAFQDRIIPLSVKIESEIAQLPKEEQGFYLQGLGIQQTGLDTLIMEAYRLLDLITFLTSGEKETRAWTIRRGTLAPQAAGVIHTDFEKGFVRVEVIEWQKFIEAGGESPARENGWIRTEGKEYVMQNGDVCHFLFNK